MIGVGRIVFGLILGSSLLMPFTVSAQSKPAPAPGTPGAGLPNAAANVHRGEVWFYATCVLCHVDRINKNETTAPLGPRLNGILKDAPASKEAAVREQIQRGSFRMPGFRYNFTPEQMDELIAYLKTL